jgi:hypothetical protein
MQANAVQLPVVRHPIDSSLIHTLGDPFTILLRLSTAPDLGVFVISTEILKLILEFTFFTAGTRSCPGEEIYSQYPISERGRQKRPSLSGILAYRNPIVQ